MFHLALLSHETGHRSQHYNADTSSSDSDEPSATNDCSMIVPHVQRVDARAPAARAHVSSLPPQWESRLQNGLKTSVQQLRETNELQRIRIEALLQEIEHLKLELDQQYRAGAEQVLDIWDKSVDIITVLEMKQAGCTDRQVNIIRQCMGKALKPTPNGTGMRWVKKRLSDDPRLHGKLLMITLNVFIVRTHMSYHMCSVALSFTTRN